MNSASISDTFEVQKNTKAASYTAIICGLILLIAILYTWPLQYTPKPIAQDFIEINLGNEKEGMGDVQPLVKGNPAPDVPKERAVEKITASHDEPSKDINADENDDKDAAPVTKPLKPNNEAKNFAKQTVSKTAKNTMPVAVANPTPAPPKLKVPLYKGGTGNGGNGSDQDNGYRNQGYKGTDGDMGSPNGKPDSYGNTPGGRRGGPRITSGDRHIIRYYSFTGDLDRATIYAIVKVTPEGTGRFAGFGRNSSTTNNAYASAIIDYLRNVQFDKSDHESTVTVQFNFNIN